MFLLLCMILTFCKKTVRTYLSICFRASFLDDIVLFCEVVALISLLWLYLLDLFQKCILNLPMKSATFFSYFYHFMRFVFLLKTVVIRIQKRSSRIMLRNMYVSVEVIYVARCKNDWFCDHSIQGSIWRRKWRDYFRNSNWTLLKSTYYKF